MPADQLQTKPMLRPTIACAVLAFALSACDDDAVRTGVPVVFAPSPAVAATISQPPFFSPNDCVGNPNVTFPFTIVISAFETVDVDRVTIQLIDGSSLGGPMVSVPKPGLTRQFGSTLVVAGTSRPFSFQPQFPCGVYPRSVSADIAYVDARGTMRNFTVERSLR